MTKTTLKKLVLFTLALISFNTFANDPKPNIILIMVDDLGYADLGFNVANSEIKSPNIDNLATGGTICTSGYAVHPFCGPSRAGLMTGRYPHAIGAQFNIQGSNEDSTEGVTLNETFFSKVLQNANYHTGLIGKWHLGLNGAYYPNQRGFDDFYGIPGGGHRYFPSDYKPLQNNNPLQWDYIKPLENNGVDTTDDNKYITDLFSDKAVDFIKDAPNDKPYFLFLSYNAPHSPLEAKAEDEAQFPTLSGGRKTYAAMVYAVDRGVGQVVQALQDEGDLDNTLIVFLSDNGGRLDNIGMASNLPLTGEKGDVFEGGYRVPMFFYWPGKVPANRKYDHPITALDLYPTFVNLADAQSQLPNDKILDGVDIWDDFIAGKNPRNKPIFAMRHDQSSSRVAAREDKWKVIKNGNGDWALYDVSTDISETNNVVNEHPEIAAYLIEQLEEWSKTHVAPEFFHSPNFGNSWETNNMPRFEQTFTIRNQNIINNADHGIETLDIVPISGKRFTISQTKNNISINLAENASFAETKVYNNSGKIIEEAISTNTNNINIQTRNFTTGIYFIKTTTPSGNSTHKFIIQ